MLKLIMTIRIVFMGSPEFSLPSLQGLIDNFKVVGVITQPDRPSGARQINDLTTGKNSC